MKLTVTATPVQHLVTLNQVFVCNNVLPLRDGKGYVMLRGESRGAPDFVFSVKERPDVSPDGIAFNSIQRICAKLSAGVDVVDVEVWNPPRKNFTLTTLVVEVDPASKKSDKLTLDVTQFQEHFRRVFDTQVFAVDQIVAIDLGGTYLKATVQEVDVLNEDEVKVDVTSQGDDLKAKHYMGMLCADTKVVVRKGSQARITLTNVPADQAMQVTNTLLHSGFNFQKVGIGGLDNEADQVFRRAFASRIFPPAFLKRLGIQHVKGILLHGPPGCGKTLMARKIGQMLNCKPPKIVNGPEVLSKYVGQSEENVRKLFADAERDQAERGDDSELHLIVFDEFDAIVKQRGSTRDNTGVADSVVNQLLSKIDGVESLNNVLLVAMTNRRDLIDEALLRPGRFEVQIEINLPDKRGREQIFTIHTAEQRKNGALAPDVDLVELSERTKNYTGAEIEGVVKAAVSYALNRLIDYDNPSKPILDANPQITMADFIAALDDVPPAFGYAKDLAAHKRRGIFDYGPVWQQQLQRCISYIAPLRSGGGQQVQSVLLEGSIGCGKTALAAHLAELSDFPCIKVVSGDDLTGLFENTKVNSIRKAFDDAHKSPYSVVILDEIEDLIDYSAVGPRFSSPLLQCIRRLIKKLPPLGRKILILGTTSNVRAMTDLDLAEHWDVIHTVPELGRDDIPRVLENIGFRFHSREDENAALDPLTTPAYIPMKKLLQVAEMARALALGPEGLPALTDAKDTKGQFSNVETKWKPVRAQHWKQAIDNLGLNREC